MANKFTRYLGSFVSGLTNPKGIVGNYRHATRLFVDDTFRLSPRTKFNFYVRFEINKNVVKAPNFSDRHIDEVGLLVKSTDLPKFNFDSVVKNQYNRKKIIYKQINYEPLAFTLHDDSAGIINALWALYYGYYIADRQNPSQAFKESKYRENFDEISKFRYGMDNNITEPFFKSISIFTMSRRRFLGYTLINPRIKTWSHGQVAYAESDTVESSMTVEYESVQYTGGNVSVNNPKGFATLHYDNLPSPLSVAGGGVANLFGGGGVLDGLESIFGDVTGGNAFGSVGGFLGTTIKAINTYKNVGKLSKDSLKKEAVNILSNPANITRAVGGVAAIFPKSTSSESGSTASQKKLTE
jgi:hypothetical protein